jgi:hypothetical protein
LLRAVKITGFTINWGAHLSTLAARVWMLHGMEVIKIQANKEQRLLNNHLVKREGSGSYKDNAHLMDIYSFPGYQVEIEVPTNPDGSSRQVILDEDLRGEMDPVILGERGVSVDEIPAGKEKLPGDDWVDGEDLGVEDNTHPEDVGPVKMTTPEPREKVWLASDVHQTSPVPYSDVDTTTAGPNTSTVRAPRAQSTKRQGRSMETSDGTIISEAKLGTIPYMVVWMVLLYTILAFQVNGALALSDHDKQIISYNCGNPSRIQAYDTSEQNHWCDLDPLIDDTNTEVTITNVSYVLLQKVPRVQIKIRTCKVTETVVPMYCGHYDHQTMVHPWPNGEFQQWWLNKEYNSSVSSRHPLMVNATIIILVEPLGRTWVTETGKVKCKGKKFDYQDKHYEDLVISHQIAIALVEDMALINLDGTLITHQEEIILACQASENSCTTDRATYLWDNPTEQEKCIYFENRRTKGTVVTTEAGDSRYMSTDGSMVRLLLKEEHITACGRLVTGTNYPTLFLAKPQYNPSIGCRLNPMDATIYTYVNAQDEYLYHSRKVGKLEERAIIRAEFCHGSQQQKLTAYASLAAEQRIQINGQKEALGGGKFVTASGEAWNVYMCKAMVARAREVGQCMTALPITLGAKEYRTYLAVWTRSTNPIKDDLIETLRLNLSLFVEPKTRMLTTVGTKIPCGGPFQPRYKNLNGRWIKTSPTLQLTTTPIDVAKLTKDWDEVMPSNWKVLNFGFCGIYEDKAVLDIEQFFQTPRAMTGIAISLTRQLIHTGLGALEPGHLFTELEDIEWTL